MEDLEDKIDEIRVLLDNVLLNEDDDEQSIIDIDEIIQRLNDIKTELQG